MRNTQDRPALPPTVAAYMAGIIDGEGCVYVNRRKVTGRRLTPGYGLKVTVTITSKLIVDWFQANVQLTSTCGFQPKGNRKYKWICTWNNSAAEWLLGQIRPYLVIKAEHADVGLEVLRHMRVYRPPIGKMIPADVVAHRETLKQRLATLNKRGKDA